jgi:hypothetical protein
MCSSEQTLRLGMPNMNYSGNLENGLRCDTSAIGIGLL